MADEIEKLYPNINVIRVENGRDFTVVSKEIDKIFNCI